MNHFYKTIFNKNTGRIDVVSENASNNSRSKNVSSSKTQTSEKKVPKKSLPTSKISYIYLLISLIMSVPAIASTNYDGTGPLTDSTTIQGNFDQLLTTQSVEGIFDQTSNDLNINYSSGATPKFVLVGYGFAAPDSTTQTINISSGNTINLKQGNINGPVYAGLAHGSVIEKTDINKLGSFYQPIIINRKTLEANNNNIKILNTAPIQIYDDIFSGYATINRQYNNINTSDFEAYSSISMSFSYHYSNKLNSNENNISISGNNNILNNISAGYTGINIEYGDLTTGDASAIPNTFDPVFTDISINNLIYGNKLNSNENNISIFGNNNILNNISAGYTGINIKYGDLTTGNLYINNYPSTYFDNRIWPDEEIYSNTLNSNENNISISGNNNILNNISAGYTGINIEYGDLKAGSFIGERARTEVSSVIPSVNTYENTLSANKNTISISGNSNILNNISAGYTGINIKYGDLISGPQITASGTTYGMSILSIEAYGNKLYTNNNKINLTGSSTISGDIKTGTIDFMLQHGKVEQANGDAGSILLHYLTDTEAYANANTISIDGIHHFTNLDSMIYGGYLNYNKNQDYFLTDPLDVLTNVKSFFRPETYDVFTGNTLNYNNRAPIKIKEIGNFQNYNFIIDSEIDDPNTPFITADTIILGSHESNMSDTSQGLKSDIHVTEIAGDKEVINNTKYILMQATNNLIENSHGTHLVESVAQQGLSRVYDVDTYIEGNNVVAVIEGGPEDNGVETNPQLDALLLGNLSGLMLLTRNADTLSDNLFNAISEQNYQRGLTPFIITSGNHTKYETGHHSNIKSDGALTTIGLSWQDEQTTLGTFVENGWDSYTTFNGFTDVTNVSGKGHNRFNGIGLYGHYDFMNGWYADATVRGGRLHTAFETDDLRKVETNERAEYKLSTNYYGANLEGGYSITFNPKNMVNLKAKYLWAQTNSQDLTVASEQIHFNKLDSHRVQFHIENLNQFTPELTFISSLGYEHEFTGKAQGHASSFGFFEIEDQSVKGGTGISSIGLRYIPSQYKNLSLDVKATGYIGKREGGMGMLKVDYTF